jgi:hypothetical protein
MIEALTYKKDGITISVGDIIPVGGGSYITNIYKAHSSGRWYIKYQPFNSEYINNWQACRLIRRLSNIKWTG